MILGYKYSEMSYKAGRGALCNYSLHKNRLHFSRHASLSPCRLSGFMCLSQIYSNCKESTVWGLPVLTPGRETNLDAGQTQTRDCCLWPQLTVYWQLQTTRSAWTAPQSVFTVVLFLLILFRGENEKKSSENKQKKTTKEKNAWGKKEKARRVKVVRHIKQCV